MMSLKKHSNLNELLDHRRELRQKQTYAERTMWTHLRKHKRGVKFRRQHSLGNFILDFYCSELHLAIEVDGASHEEQRAQHYDLYRQKILEGEGIRFLRFTDFDVVNDSENTFEKIDTEIVRLQTKNVD